MSVLDDLDRLFPDHRSDARAAAWEVAKARYPVGSMVRGVVVARYPFGAFVDIDAGFPALLEIIRMAGLTPERYRVDDWCPVGSVVSAFVGGHGDRQIGLWQVQPGEAEAAPRTSPLVMAEGAPRFPGGRVDSRRLRETVGACG